MRRFAHTWRFVTPSFFSVMGVPLVAGRTLDRSAPDGIVVSETLAEHLWPEQSPIGHVVRVGTELRRVVGVAADADLGGASFRGEFTLARGRLTVYEPLTTISPAARLLIRAWSSGDFAVSSRMNQDFLDLLRAFNDHEVRYLVVGAYALGVHGRPRATGDLGVWVDATPENAPRVMRALAAFGAPLTGVGETDFAAPAIVFQMGLPPVRMTSSHS